MKIRKVNLSERSQKIASYVAASEVWAAWNAIYESVKDAKTLEDIQLDQLKEAVDLSESWMKETERRLKPADLTEAKIFAAIYQFDSMFFITKEEEKVDGTD